MTAPDTRWLTTEVTKDEITQFSKTDWRAETYAETSAFADLAARWFFPGLGALAFLAYLAVMGFISVTHGEGNGAAFGITLTVVIGAVVATPFIIIGVRSRKPRVTERQYRLHMHAAANNLSYRPSGGSLIYPGLIFGEGENRTATDRFRSTFTDRYVDIGTFKYGVELIEDAPVQLTRSWGYVAVRLDRNLPHMVLDAKSNNFGRSTNLPASFGKRQHLSLEGDFDKYFTLYVTPGYERDALYVFTPDLMARLIDNASTFDVEIVDDWLLMYSNQPLALDRPDTWERLYATLDAIIPKTVKQTQHYRDDRVPGEQARNWGTFFGAPEPAPEGFTSVEPETGPTVPLHATAEYRSPNLVSGRGQRLTTKNGLSVAGIVVFIWYLLSTFGGPLFSILFNVIHDLIDRF